MQFDFFQKISDDPNISMDKTNDYPYILAMGDKKTEIKCFYIVFEKKPILVSTKPFCHRVCYIQSKSR